MSDGGGITCSSFITVEFSLLTPVAPVTSILCTAFIDFLVFSTRGVSLLPLPEPDVCKDCCAPLSGCGLFCPPGCWGLGVDELRVFVLELDVVPWSCDVDITKRLSDSSPSMSIKSGAAGSVKRSSSAEAMDSANAIVA